MYLPLSSMILLFLNSLLLLLSTCVTLDTIRANQAINDGKTIVSDGEMFELGFFSPGNSKNRYLGIWYKKISYGTVVWVANRETPIHDNSGMFTITTEGALNIFSSDRTMIWSSNSTVSVRGSNPLAQLLDSGNLVVWDANRTKEDPIWQSFDYPGNTLIPGMKFGKDLVTGREWSVTSWKSADDPSPGLYLSWLETNGYPQMMMRQGPQVISRFGPWNGLKYQGLPIRNPNPIYSLELIINEKEIYNKYELKSSVLQRILVMSNGNTVQLNWIEQIQDWVVNENAPIDTCSPYGFCGPYGSCSIKRYPPCYCMEGFRPRFQDEWNTGNWSGGCQHKKALKCGSGDGFRKISGVKFPDTRHSWYNVSMTLEECKMVCIRNCSCTAYSNLDIRNGGSGCLLWFDELIDIREYDEDQELYIRIDASELAGSKKGVVTVVLSTSSAVLLLFAVAYSCMKKKKSRHMKGGENWYAHNKKNSSGQMEDLDELPFFNLYEIVKATDNFSINNKIGEGGFGPVYKGVLEDGREVAMKRLSETSHQGLDEFKNEITCIAKLQHRNLVKLLGYCVHGNEMILIYEYMANKSLDTILFDEIKSSLLNWPQRFHIIHGMA